MTAIKPTTPFDFTKAVSQPFQTPEGKTFAWRLTFWTSVFMSVYFLLYFPIYFKIVPTLAELNWRSMHDIWDYKPGEQLTEMFNEISGYIVIMMVISLAAWIVFAAGETALHRKRLSGEEHPKQPLRLGKDEGRVMLAQLGVCLIWFLAYVLGALGLAMIVVIFSAVKILAVVFIVIAFIVYIGLLVYIPVRLSPAAALSFAKHKRCLLSARDVSKYRFWPLFLCYAVVGIGGYIAIYIYMAIAMMMVFGDADVFIQIMGMGETNPREAMEGYGERLGNPVIIALGVILTIGYSALMSFWWLCYSGIGTYAVSWWRADGGEISEK